MSLNNFKVKLLSFAVSSAVLSLAPNLANAENFESEMVIIHPFQWTYDNIAKECTEYLGPAGFDGVQISQPAVFRFLSQRNISGLKEYGGPYISRLIIRILQP